MPTVRYWISPGGHYKDYSVAVSHEAIANACRELESVCRKLKYERVSSKSKARVRIYFQNEADMTHGPAAGRMYNNGTMLLTASRKIFGSSPKAIPQHEFLHERGLGHTDERRCTMGPTAANHFMCKQEVKWLQKRYKLPLEKWYPYDRKRYGDFTRNAIWVRDEYLYEWEALKAARDKLTDKKLRAEAQKLVLIKVMQLKGLGKKLAEYHKAWWEHHDYWRGTPMVGGY